MEKGGRDAFSELEVFRNAKESGRLGPKICFLDLEKLW